VVVVRGRGRENWIGIGISDTKCVCVFVCVSCVLYVIHKISIIPPLAGPRGARGTGSARPRAADNAHAAEKPLKKKRNHGATPPAGAAPRSAALSLYDCALFLFMSILLSSATAPHAPPYTITPHRARTAYRVCLAVWCVARRRARRVSSCFARASHCGPLILCV